MISISMLSIVKFINEVPFYTFKYLKVEYKIGSHKIWKVLLSGFNLYA